MTTNFYAKQGETVDFGGEVDYSNYQWFSDPPARREVSSNYELHSVTLSDNL